MDVVLEIEIWRLLGSDLQVKLFACTVTWQLPDR